MGEIKIIYDDLEKGIEKMAKLANSTSAVNLQLDFANSRGQMVDSLINIQNQTNTVQKVLTDLYKNTAASLQKTYDTFESTDKKLADSYKNKEENGKNVSF